jgi:predicted RNase H-like HicB family nuclease
LNGTAPEALFPVGSRAQAENEIESELRRSIMNIKAIVHEEDGGRYWAEVPAIPGCATQGQTIDELLLANSREAIEGCLSVDVEAPFRDGKECVLEIAI